MQDSNQMPTLFSLNGENLIYPEEKFTPTFPEQTESDVTTAVKADGKQRNNRRNWSADEERGFYEIWGRDNWKLTLPGKTKQTFTQWSEELNARFGMVIKFTEIQGKVNQTRLKFKQEVKQLVKGENSRRWKKFDLIRQILSNQYRPPGAEPIPIEALEKNRDMSLLEQVARSQGNNNVMITNEGTYNVMYTSNQVKAQQQLDSLQPNLDVETYNDPKNNNNNNNNIDVLFENNDNINDKLKDNNKFIFNNGIDENSENSLQQLSQQEDHEMEHAQQQQYFINLQQNNEKKHILQEPQEFLTQQLSQHNPTNSTPPAYIQSLTDTNNISGNNIINSSISNEQQDTQTSLLKQSIDSPQMPFFSQSPHVQNTSNNVSRPNANNLSVIRSTLNAGSEFQKNYIESFLTQNKDQFLSPTPSETKPNNSEILLTKNNNNKFQFGVTATGEIDATIGLPNKKPVCVTQSQSQMIKSKAAKKLQEQQQKKAQSVSIQPEVQAQKKYLQQQEQPSTSSSSFNTNQQKTDESRKIRKRWLPDVELEYLMEVRKRNLLLSEQKDISLQAMKLEEKKIALMEQFFPKCVEMHEAVLKQFMSFSSWANDPNQNPTPSKEPKVQKKQESKPKTEVAKTTENNTKQ